MYEYPFGNGQQLNLDWFLSEWKNLLAAWEAEKNGIEGALQAEIDRAEAALADVFAARDAAAQSAANALESKNAAAQSASDASGYLATVHADANTASNAAQNAAQSESNAADSAQTALASKNNAADSASAAAQSAQNANASKDAAAQSAADALANKDAAAQSAADALANKNAAAQSAEDAEDAVASVESSAQQIATNTREISNLKESINNISNFQIEYSKEQAPYKGYINGQTGGIELSSGWFASDYLFVTSNQLKIYCSLHGSGGLAFYDINKTFISGINGNNAGEYGFISQATAIERTIIVPQNAFYIRFGAYESNSMIYMKGTIIINNLIHYLSNIKALAINRAIALALSN